MPDRRIYYSEEARQYAMQQQMLRVVLAATLGLALGAGLALLFAPESGATDLDVVTGPGRALVADAAILLTRALYRKSQGGKRFVIVDAGITELIRPALYGAFHAIAPVRAREGALTPADVVGPICESGDFFAHGRMLPPIEEGDLIAIYGAGAYGREMSSTYNARPLAPEVLVEGASFRVVRRRQTVEELWRLEE